MACRNRQGKPVNLGKSSLCVRTIRLELGNPVRQACNISSCVDTPMASSFASGGFRGRILPCAWRPQQSPEQVRRQGVARETRHRHVRGAKASSSGSAHGQTSARLQQQPLLPYEPVSCFGVASSVRSRRLSTREELLLIEVPQRCAKAQGRKVAFTTNAADLGNASSAS